MSKIAEKRVKELGYSKDPFNRQEFTANDIFDCGVECYDQAIQDFIEKVEKILTEKMYFSDDEVKEFKNYMQDESEN